MAPYLTLDFNAPRAIRLVHRAALCVGALTLLVGAIQLATAWQERSQARAELASLEQRRAGRTAGPQVPVDGAAIRAAAVIARDLRAPWPELMRSMEASRNSDISLLQVEPVVAQDSIRITADARHADAMLDYLAQLSAQGLSDVVLTSHQIRAQEPGAPIRFQAQARWTNLAPASSTVVAASGVAPKPSDTGLDLFPLQLFLEQERATR